MIKILPYLSPYNKFRLACNPIMEYETTPFALYTASHDRAFKSYPFGISLGNPLIADLANLQNEKEILENGLANCVTYLLALRKKRARNLRKLTTDPLPPRKKRKKIQQSNRDIEKEIKNHERDEGAYLNNLQACKTNIYLAQGLSQTMTDAGSPGVDYFDTAQLSTAVSELTEMSWDGWADDAPVSPFETYRHNPLLDDNVAPDELRSSELDDTVSIKNARPWPLQIRTSHGPSVPAPPNTARSNYLSPIAAAFEPSSSYFPHEVDDNRDRIDSLDLLPVTIDEYLDETMSLRRITEVSFSDISPSLDFHLLPRIAKERNNTWCTSTPQRSPQKCTHEEERMRSRSNSM